jgi:hypothetical protein
VSFAFQIRIIYILITNAILNKLMKDFQEFLSEMSIAAAAAFLEGNIKNS